MTSEIRVNKIQNRVGLGTIEYSNTGPVISGVTTSNNFKTCLLYTSDAADE